MYSEGQLTEILRKLLTMPAETEVVEFKRAENSFPDAVLGQYFSALSNEANLKEMGRDMSKNERIQACYQHICLMYERQESVGNVSVRDRFGLNKNQAGIVSHILKDTIDAGLIKVEDPDSESRRYATYVPYYA